MKKRSATRFFDFGAWPVVLLPAGYLIYMAVVAFLFPMELEVREGLLWLYVLAHRSGISVYDHSQVAYYGTHGPILHVLQAWSGWIFPFFEAQHMVRVFVLLAPIACLLPFLAACSAGRRPARSWWIGVGFAACLYAGLINLSSYNLLVGRTDSLAIVLLALQAALAVRFMMRERATVLEVLLFNALAVILIVSIWRFFPYALVVWAAGVLPLARYRPLKLAKHLAVFMAALALLVSLCVFAQFDGNIDRFYRHMFGFYFDPSLAVIGAGETFELFPKALLFFKARAGAVYFPMGVATALLVVLRRRIFRYWAELAALLWLAYLVQAYGYYKNLAGFNGPYYFSAQILLSWVFLFALLAKGRYLHRRILIGAAVGVYLILVPDWGQVKAQTDNLTGSRVNALAFRERLTELYEKGELMSEDLQFFKRTLRDSTVDNGDGVESLMLKGYFGLQFGETARRFFQRVRSGAYPYFVYGGVASGGTRDFLNAKYRLLARGPAYDNMNGPGGCRTSINCVMLLVKKP